MEKELAILMADLTGYTAMTDVHGGASAARIVQKYMEIVDLARYGGTKVMQRIGDQVVMVADDAGDLLETAKRLNTLTREEHHFLSIHAGLHFGPILIENNNLFGSTINVAARIMNVACRGQIFCSSAFLHQLPSESRELFRSTGFHKLKNVMTQLELFELLPSAPNEVYVDPVCHMHIDPIKPSLSAEYNGFTYHFCSDHCKSLFLATPDQFVVHQDL
ncbi:MAG TPA: YHS domain-containing protein [Chryseosolibacter sp.]